MQGGSGRMWGGCGEAPHPFMKPTLIWLRGKDCGY